MTWPLPDPEWMAEIPEDKRARVEESWLSLTEASRRETAMCLWEAVLDDMARVEDSRWEKVRYAEGSPSVRDRVALMVVPCEFGWLLLSRDPQYEDRAWAYDFEYVPGFLAACVAADTHRIELRTHWIDALRAMASLTN